jgi:serine/threonine protein kinase
MTIDSATAFVTQVRQHQLLGPEEMAALTNLHARFPDLKPLAAEVLKRGWLTRFQLTQLLRGRAPYLVLGQYVLLDQLGEGATGYVFKGRHRGLKRLAAIKVIRRELLVKSSAVERFYREVHSVGRLRHPNIVIGYDAGPVGPTHFFAMEFVEGTDLGKLVERTGPLPVDRACDYVRQAALGLQHAHERGLVHRDVKPSNLMLSEAESQVKVLDLGLVRLDRASLSSGVANGTLTESGGLLGTPDYIAPEQLEDSRRVDIRADIYGLGASLYYLICGKVPFPDCTLYQKLVRVQVAEPVPIESVRPDVAPAVSAIVRRMMAKRPEDRFSTPAEVAAALEAVLASDQLSVSDPPPPVLEQGIVAVPSSKRDTAQGSWGTVNEIDEVPLPDYLERKHQRQHRFRRLTVIGASALAGLLVLFLALLAFTSLNTAPPAKTAPVVVVTLPQTLPKTERETKAPPRYRPAPEFERWAVDTARLNPTKQVEAVAAKLRELNPGYDGALTPIIKDGVVLTLALPADRLTDVSPVRAFPQLRHLEIVTTGPNRSPFSDLRPLQDLPLTALRLSNTQVADLSQLKGMSLQAFGCPSCPVTDLTPLKGMPLLFLEIPGTGVTDLAPIADAPLTRLECHQTRIADLSPLTGKHLVFLNCSSTLVADLSPLRGMRLVTMMCGSNNIADLSPLKDAPLESLDCANTRVTDLSVLRGKPLKQFGCLGCPVTDVSPVSESPLRLLVIAGTRVKDLSPLREVKSLATLICNNTPVADLSPLKDLPIETLNIAHTEAVDLSPIHGLGLKSLTLNFRRDRDAAWLGAVKTLETINGKPAAMFLQQAMTPVP